MQNKKYNTIIVGGGASGMFAAIWSAYKYKEFIKNSSSNNSKFRILILEKNNELGKKLKITGGGRCNITNNNPDFHSFIANYKDSKEFLYTAFSIFGVKDTFEFFQSRGLSLITEDNFRTFPITQKAISVFNILISEIQNINQEGNIKIEILYNKVIKELKVNKINQNELNNELNKDESNKDNINSVCCQDEDEYFAENFILSTGGASHPETGSSGDGFQILQNIGHRVVAPNMSLVPLVSEDQDIKSLSGLSLQNVKFKILLDNKVIYKQKSIYRQKTYVNALNTNSNLDNKILFTDFGLSGPSILNISKIINENLSLGSIQISLDLLPDLNLENLNKYLQNIIFDNHKKKIKNIQIANIPDSLWQIVISRADVDPETYCSILKKQDRNKIINILKFFFININGVLGPDKAIVSSGGVSPEEIDFRTMKSKLYNNLYIVGDLLNIDRKSGGFSLQLCWTTGAIAGRAIKI